jgi:hypothetical protein
MGQVLSAHDIHALASAALDLPHLIVVDAIGLLAGGDVLALKHLAVDLRCAVLAAVTVAALRPSERFIPHQAHLDACDILVWAPGGVESAVFARIV